MNLDILKNINQIIERDSKDTTYKFALLRATIESIQQKTPYQSDLGEYISLPVGLLVFKWLEYYYPIIEANLPQKNGDDVLGKSLAFRTDFKEITDFYADKGGLSVFYNGFVKGKIDKSIENKTYELCKKIKQTIITMPMKYIGFSVYKDYYQIFQPLKNKQKITKPNTLDVLFLLENFGYYTIPKDYYTIFEYLGSFITGTHSILLNWAEFTVEKSKNTLNINQVLNEILKSPIDERDIGISKKMFEKLKNEKHTLECVWSGKQIENDLNIEHLLPFAIWKNNDLWNLLPSKAEINNNKKDKIPSIKLIEKRKDCIIEYWQYIHQEKKDVFEQGLTINLLNSQNYKLNNWENLALEAFKDKCKYLIEIRGFEEWNYHP